MKTKKTQPSRSLKRVVSRRWKSSYRSPTRRGWYEVKARDNRWNGETRWRAWGSGMWWIPLKDGWLSSPLGLYKWRGPRIGLDDPNAPNSESANE